MDCAWRRRGDHIRRIADESVDPGGFGWSMTSSSSISHHDWTSRMRLAMFGNVSKIEVGLGALVLYGIVVCLSRVALYPGNSLTKLGCWVVMYIVGAGVIGGLACSEIDCALAARAILFRSWIFQARSWSRPQRSRDCPASVRRRRSTEALRFESALSTPRLLNTSSARHSLGSRGAWLWSSLRSVGFRPGLISCRRRLPSWGWATAPC